MSPNVKIGDWYLFEKHTMIIIYGFEEEPYLLPTFLTPRLYSLEYIRRRISVDLFHFVSDNKTSNFKFQQNIGPFVVKNRSDLKVINEIAGYEDSTR